jgi:putative ATPase
VQLIGLPEGLFSAVAGRHLPGAGAEVERRQKRSTLQPPLTPPKLLREPVPLHLRNAVTPLMKHIGYGKDYRYVHSDPDAKEEMECLPAQLRGRKYFETDEDEQ